MSNQIELWEMTNKKHGLIADQILWAVDARMNAMRDNAQAIIAEYQGRANQEDLEELDFKLRIALHSQTLKELANTAVLAAKMQREAYSMQYADLNAMSRALLILGYKAIPQSQLKEIAKISQAITTPETVGRLRAEFLGLGKEQLEQKN